MYRFGLLAGRVRDSTDTMRKLGAQVLQITPRVVAAVLLFWALDKHTYDYYVVLRWVTCAVAGYSTYVAIARKQTGWACMLGVIAMMFNPIIPVHLGRSTWAIIDVVSAVVLLVSVMFVRDRGGVPQARQSINKIKGSQVRSSA